MKITFKGEAKRPKNAVVVIFDLESFSAFVNLPDVHQHIPAYLNSVLADISVAINGGRFSFHPPERAESDALDIRLVHQKFLGDGGLYVFLPPKGRSDFSKQDIGYLCNALWNFKNNFGLFIKKCQESIPVAELPPKIRFGISRGSIYELKPETDSNEYVGFCINLASRLQKYCPELGFIASARLLLDNEFIKKHGYIKVVATSLRGFPPEIVLVDKSEYEDLPAETRDRLFKSLK